MDQEPKCQPEATAGDDVSGLRPATPVSRNTVTDDLSWPDRIVPLAHLGNGGMARVTLAMLHGDFEFATPVAVKRLLPRLANQPGFVDMFLDEAFVAGRISHPHVVAVRDVMRHRGEPVMVLEYLEGLSASRLIRALLAHGSVLPIASAARIVLDGLSGLAAAHALRSEVDGHLEGLVHRDVSPQNLFVCSSGHTKLIDFGITRVRGRLSVTDSRSIKGKFGYMAPEQLDGEYDQRVDVFAMGVVLFELLTSSRLFRGASERDTVAAVMSEHRPSVLERRPRCPPALAEIVHVAIQRDPARRFASAEAMARAMAAALADVDPCDARGCLSERVWEAAGEEFLELRGLIAANRASLPPGRFAPSRSLPPPGSLSDGPVESSDRVEREDDTEEAVPTLPVLANERPSRSIGQMLTSALTLVVLGVAAALWWVGCAETSTSDGVEVVSGDPRSTPVESRPVRDDTVGSEHESLRCEPAHPQCPDGFDCARGVDPADWSVGRCVERRHQERDVALPLRHPRGVRATHSGRDVSGSHAYLDTLYALDLVAEADAVVPRGTVVAVADGVVVDVHVDCPEPSPGTDDPCGQGYGNHVRLQHDDGTFSFYAHLIDVRVRAEERVAAGSVLGTEGWTGRAGARHLHFALQVRGPGGRWQSVPYRLRTHAGPVDVEALRCSWQAPCELWHEQ